MDEVTKQLLTYVLAIIIYPLAFYIEYLIVKRLIKFGINYFFEQKSGEQIVIYDGDNEYYKMSLTRSELDEISIALKVRIEETSKKLNEAQTPEGKKVLEKILQDCIAAQKQTTYAGQPEKYQYQDEYREEDR